MYCGQPLSTNQSRLHIHTPYNTGPARPRRVKVVGRAHDAETPDSTAGQVRQSNEDPKPKKTTRRVWWLGVPKTLHDEV